ncbi:MAG TPA: helix-turn-helix domain-containing protein [Bacilli bacterium]|nr:helix-turn-helix domain-containing protein [Bacilli bacterium]
MLGTKIKQLRSEHNLTQRELADLLYVSTQAVSRWENGDVEPSVTTLRSMAQIFNVTLDELLGADLPEHIPEEKVEVVKEEIEEIKEESKPINTAPVLAVCEICNQPIYNPKKIIRRKDAYGRSVVCTDCVAKEKQARLKAHILESKRRRTKAFIVPGIIAGLWLLLGSISAFSSEMPAGYTRFDMFASILVMAIPIFTFPACLILKNNFIREAMATVFTFAFVKFPGIIFTLDIGGIIFLITVKLFFFVLGIFLMIFFGGLALAVGIGLSVFVYPFALYNNYKNPEKTELNII